MKEFMRCYVDSMVMKECSKLHPGQVAMNGFFSNHIDSTEMEDPLKPLVGSVDTGESGKLFLDSMTKARNDL
jgi:hypothetical protein